MELSQIELFSIKFITKFYGLIWPFPFFWNFDDNTLRVNNKDSCKMFRTIVGFAALIMTATMINSVVYPILLPNYPYGRIDKFILMLTCVAIFGLNYLIFVTTTAFPYDFTAIFNGVLSVEDALGHSKYSYMKLITLKLVIIWYHK